ncbi:MAG: hypothetical protein KGR16_02585 [Verrucomicrobia bacterium]|nr:hypothetical protein [Verrucomicrobiota bacterium]MDE3048261.1 hypothetical protein [Verrucomicrobiota bacterium]
MAKIIGLFFCFALFAESPVSRDTWELFPLNDPPLDAPLLEKLAQIGIDCTFITPVRHIREAKAAAERAEQEKGCFSDFNRLAHTLGKWVDQVPFQPSRWVIVDEGMGEIP